MKAVDAAWRLLAVEATTLMDTLSGGATPPDKQPSVSVLTR